MAERQRLPRQAHRRRRHRGDGRHGQGPGHGALQGVAGEGGLHEEPERLLEGGSQSRGLRPAGGAAAEEAADGGEVAVVARGDPGHRQCAGERRQKGRRQGRLADRGQGRSAPGSLGRRRREASEAGAVAQRQCLSGETPQRRRALGRLRVGGRKGPGAAEGGRDKGRRAEEPERLPAGCGEEGVARRRWRWRRRRRRRRGRRRGRGRRQDREACRLDQRQALPCEPNRCRGPCRHERNGCAQGHGVVQGARREGGHRAQPQWLAQERCRTRGFRASGRLRSSCWRSGQGGRQGRRQGHRQGRRQRRRQDSEESRLVEQEHLH
mmetsp:Transcript_176035/g.559194  ORF Transcript_176035/g.559194 Transcript_176035/m.559194 type:complete len:323 (+) Transcript_176035:96-1064(+)